MDTQVEENVQQEAAVEENIESSNNAISEVNEKISSLESALKERDEVLKDLQAQNAYFKQKAEERVETKEPEKTYLEDDIPNFRDVNSLVEDKVSKLEKELQKEREARQKQMIIDRGKAFVAQHPDFEEVKKYAMQLAEKDPELTNDILNSKNPYSLLYRVGSSHPDYIKQREAKAKENIANKISDNLNKTPSLASSGGGESNKKGNVTDNMTPDQKYLYLQSLDF